MAKKKKRVSKRKIAAIVAGTIAATGLLWFGVKGTSPIPVPLYTVTRVFDGDTFETKEKQYIRLSGIDAPELGRCGAEEAKKELERLVLGKPVFIKSIYHTGPRSNGLVYTPSGFVNAAMLASGWATMNDRDNVDSPELYNAAKEARQKKLGVFGTKCTQTTNTRCPIKGNVGYENKPLYHTPDCPQYKNVIVELYKGDRWFCSEKEAKAAGFTKNPDCR